MRQIIYMLGIFLIMLEGCEKKDNDEIKVTGTVEDIEGNIYKTIEVGEQTWMTENLKTTKLSNGNPITLVTEASEWGYLTTAAYCWYDNDIKNKDVYGALYNWYTVSNDKLCPDGWHVPSEDEWVNLSDFLGGDHSGGELKETGVLHWKNPNTKANNKSGFTALPGGWRTDGANTVFSNVGENGFWWNATEKPIGSAWSRILSYSDDFIWSGPQSQRAGLSVRCIKN